MSRLYIAPIGSNGDWVERFEETVATPVTLPDDRPEPLADTEHTGDERDGYLFHVEFTDEEVGEFCWRDFRPAG